MPAHSLAADLAAPIIGLIGGECTGKSALAADLHQTLDSITVPEELRTFVERHGRPPRASEQALIMRAQARAIEAAVTQHSSAFIVSDPAPLMTAVYSMAYFDDPGLLDEGIEISRSMVLLFCRPDLPWVADGIQRDGEHMRALVDSILSTTVVPALRELGVAVHEISGTPDQRLRTAGALIQGTSRPHA